MISEDEIVFLEEPRRYVYRNKPYRSVTDFLREAGFCEDFSKVRPEVLANGQRRGQMVHKACEYLDLGMGLDWSTVDPRIEGFVRAHERMILEKKLKVISVEKKVVSPGLCGIGVGGRPDAIYWMNGKRVLIDRKSGNSHKKRDGKIQTGGYKAIIDNNTPKNPIEARYVEKLFSDGRYKLEPCDDPYDVLCFYDILKWCAQNKKRKAWLAYYKFEPAEDLKNGHADNDHPAAGH